MDKYMPFKHIYSLLLKVVTLNYAVKQKLPCKYHRYLYFGKDHAVKEATKLGLTVSYIRLHNLQKERFSCLDAVKNTLGTPSLTQDSTIELPTK